MKTIASTLILLGLSIGFLAQPTPIMQTYFGGSIDDASLKTRTLPNGDFVVSGRTNSTTGIAFGNSSQALLGGDYDVTLTYFNSDGSVEWSTYIGGNQFESTNEIAYADENHIVVTGFTNSSIFYTTPTAFSNVKQGSSDQFIRVFNTQGDLLYSSYFGGSESEIIYGLYVDENGDLIMCGSTTSPNLGTSDALQVELTTDEALFFAKLSLANGLEYFSYFNEIINTGTGRITKYSNGDFCVWAPTTATENIATSGAFISQNLIGNTSMIGRFTPSGQKIWASYFGDGNNLVVNEIGLDENENIIIVGRVNLGSNIATAGAYSTSIVGLNDPFIFKINSNQQPAWCTYFGGQEFMWDELYGVAITANGNIFLCGYTNGAAGLATSNAYQTELSSNNQNEAMLVEFNSTGNLLYCSYFGALESEIFFDLTISQNQLVIVGSTNSTSGLNPTQGLDTSYGGGTFDAYITKWDIELLHEELEKQTIQVYPNPSVDGRIHFNRAISLERIDAYDLQGKLVYANHTFLQRAHTIDLPLPTGIYTLHLTQDNQEKIVARVSVLRD